MKHNRGFGKPAGGQSQTLLGSKGRGSPCPLSRPKKLKTRTMEKQPGQTERLWAKTLPKRLEWSRVPAAPMGKAEGHGEQRSAPPSRSPTARLCCVLQRGGTHPRWEARTSGVRRGPGCAPSLTSVPLCRIERVPTERSSECKV